MSHLASALASDGCSAARVVAYGMHGLVPCNITAWGRGGNMNRQIPGLDVNMKDVLRWNLQCHGTPA